MRNKKKTTSGQKLRQQARGDVKTIAQIQKSLNMDLKKIQRNVLKMMDWVHDIPHPGRRGRKRR
jgi:hypothetical protein